MAEGSLQDARVTSATVTIRGSSIARWLAVVTALVSAAGLAVELAKRPLDLPADEGAVPYFSLSYEENVPTYFSAALLAGCAVLLAVSARAAQLARRRHVVHWWILAAGFALMSLDESIELHEHLAFFATSGVLYFSWVIPGAVIVAIVGASFLPFLAQLPKTTRWLFVASGAVYVLGAVGFELPLGWWTSHHGKDNLGYAIIDWVEETLEMVGAQMFLYSLFRHLASVGVTVGFGREGAKT